MPSSTIAIVIGVSYYLNQDIIPLPAAQADAMSFARAVRNWGIPESNIALFLNQRAEKKVLDNFFIELSKKKESYKLLFYFCGHGYRNDADPPQSYLLVYDSFIENKKCFNAVNLDFIIEQLNKLNVSESYIFIDACSLRINRLIHPKLDEEINGQKISQKSLFCLLSSGILESYEDEKGGYGYFTQALLKGLCKISKVDGSPTQLLNYINEEMEQEELPSCEPYSIGNQSISFLPSCSFPGLQKGFIDRYEVVAKIQDMLIQNRQKSICLTGEAGIGKSALCRSLVSEKLKTFYLAIPALSTELFDPIDCLASFFRGLAGESLDGTESSLEIILKFDEKFPYSLVIVDQLERLSPKQVNLLIKTVVDLKGRFLFVSNQSLKNLIADPLHDNWMELVIPPFSSDEGKQLIKMIKPECTEAECELVYLVSQGSPLKMIKVVFYKAPVVQKIQLQEEFKKIISAIYASGSYIDEQLFVKTFNLQENVLTFLKEIGLIFFTKVGWFPHDYLLEIAESEELEIDRAGTLSYWFQQVEDIPDHPQAALHLILSVRCFGYHEMADRYLRQAFETLHSKGKEYLDALVEGAGIFLSCPHLTEASLCLIEILIDWGEYELSNRLLNKRGTLKELDYRAQLCKVQCLWKIGQLEASIALCSKLIEEIDDISYQIKCYFYRGISWFLNGNWNEAFADFTMVCENAQNKYYKGRAQCMLGTIIGLRGSDIQLGKEHLEAGIRLLTKLKDLAGIWTGWNNLGEIFWKSGEYRASAFYLEKALELSTHLDDKGAKLETLRNLLQLHLRVNGPFSKQVTNLMTEIESLDWRKLEIFEQLPLLNTLSTVYIFQRNIKKALLTLKNIIPLTVHHKEYHIHTLCNLSLLFNALKIQDKSQAFYSRAVKLAEQGGNFLAIHQLKSDFDLFK